MLAHSFLKRFRAIGLIGAVLVMLVPSGASADPSPGAARLYSALLPGAGHMYAGESSKGLTLMSLYVGSLALAIGTGPWTWEDEEEGDPFFSDLAEGTGTSTTTKVIFAASAATAGITWLYAVIDAPKAVRRYGLAPEWRHGEPRLALTATF
jgi:hypothetical protein